jgi:hypothetical protein
MRIRTKTILERMEAQPPDKVLDEIEAKRCGSENDDAPDWTQANEGESEWAATVTPPKP